MKTYAVFYQSGAKYSSHEWMHAGNYKAMSARGAIIQFVTRFYGSVVAVKATLI